MAATLLWAARIGLRDFFVFYTPAAWVAGWCARGVAQTLFFGLVGVLSSVPGQGSYMALGNAVLLVAISGMLGLSSTGWERSEGTLVFLVAGGGSVLAGLLGRASQHLLAGYPAAVLSGAVALAVLRPGTLDAAGLAPAALLLLSIGLSSLGLSMALGALLLRVRTGRNLISNVSYTLLMVLCGVNFPVEELPAWLSPLASALPVTHGLAAIRDVLAGAPVGTTARGLAAELAVAAGWLLFAAVVLRLAIRRARVRGTLDWMY